MIKKVIRIGSMNEQDNWRRDDLRVLSSEERLESLILMQAKYLRWDINSKIERVGALKRLNFQNV